MLAADIAYDPHRFSVYAIASVFMLIQVRTLLLAHGPPERLNSEEYKTVAKLCLKVDVNSTQGHHNPVARERDDSAVSDTTTVHTVTQEMESQPVQHEGEVKVNKE